MAIKLVSPSKPQFDTPEEELYRRVHELVYDRIDGLTSLGATGVLTYITHEIMHTAMDADVED